MMNMLTKYGISKIQYPHIGVSFKQKKEYSTNRCYDMDKPKNMRLSKEARHNQLYVTHDSFYLYEKSKLDSATDKGNRLLPECGKKLGADCYQVNVSFGCNENAL